MFNQNYKISSLLCNCYSFDKFLSINYKINRRNIFNNLNFAVYFIKELEMMLLCIISSLKYKWNTDSRCYLLKKNLTSSFNNLSERFIGYLTRMNRKNTGLLKVDIICNFQVNLNIHLFCN